MPDHQDILTHFIQRVWNAADVEARVDYLAPSYIIHHDPGDP